MAEGIERRFTRFFRKSPPRCTMSDTPNVKDVGHAADLKRSGPRYASTPTSPPRPPPKRFRARPLTLDVTGPPQDDMPILIKQPETRPISHEQLVNEMKGIYAGLIMVETRCIELDKAHDARIAHRRMTGPPEDDMPKLVKQPETRPISQEQLVNEVKGIYAGLIMVEAKCIEVDKAHNTLDSGTRLNHEQWQALIELYRTLLHEHHDFFLASQHPNTSPALRRLDNKYAMPARMWRHGVHSFIELLRHRLPASQEHMLTFIYLAYSMMAPLYETVPEYEDMGVECLGDLARYRMAIEEHELRDCEAWKGVSKTWYSKAPESAPTVVPLAYLENPTSLEACELPLRLSPPRNSTWLTKITGIIRPRAVVKLLRIYISLAFISLVFADPEFAGDRYRTPKLLLLGGSAISSLGTGMTSLQLEIADDPHGAKLAKMSLRIACSTFLGILAVGYPLWFLPYARKTQRFLSGLGGVGLFLWLFMRRDPSSATTETGDTFAWLDDLNLFGLIAVVAGILNAESSLMASAFARGETHNIAADAEVNVNNMDRRRRADEESHGDLRDHSGDFGLAVVSGVAQTMAGA